MRAMRRGRRVMPYLCKDRISLNERIMILGDIKVQWATGSPLAQLDALTKGKVVLSGTQSCATIHCDAATQATEDHVYNGCLYDRQLYRYEARKIGASNHCLGASLLKLMEMFSMPVSSMLISMVASSTLMLSSRQLE